MTKYQLVPYLVRVHVRGAPKETRPLDDLDAGGLDLATELNGLLQAHTGKTVVQGGNSVRPHKIRLDSVGQGDRSLNFVVAPGRSGISSDITRPDGTSVKREFDDTEHVPLGHYLVYGSGRHDAVLLAERVGGDGAISALRLLMTQSWANRHEDLVLTIDSAGDEKLWESVLSKRPVVKYQMTRPARSDGALAVSKQEAVYTLDVKPATRGKLWSLKPTRARAKKADRPLRSVLLEEVTPVLAPGYEDPADGAEALMDEGWSVAVQLELESGQRPLVNVESNTSVTLTFPVIDGQEEPAQLPEMSDVHAAVKRLVKAGVFTKNGVKKNRADGLEWVETVAEYDGKPWKVVWDVVDPDASGVLPDKD